MIREKTPPDPDSMQFRQSGVGVGEDYNGIYISRELYKCTSNEAREPGIKVGNQIYPVIEIMHNDQPHQCPLAREDSAAHRLEKRPKIALVGEQEQQQLLTQSLRTHDRRCVSKCI